MARQWPVTFNIGTFKAMKETYNKAYKQEEVRLWWENAPGKAVILKALDGLLEDSSENADSKYSRCSLVDIGCGTGFFLNVISSKYKLGRFIGIDLSLEAITMGRHLYPHLDLRCEDACHTSIKKSTIDFLIGYGCYEHFLDPLAGLREASMILKKNGIFLLMMPTLGIDRTDRTDEGWYEEREIDGQPILQKQWNFKRVTWESLLKKAGLMLWDFDLPRKFGAIKPGVFFFGVKPETV